MTFVLKMKTLKYAAVVAGGVILSVWATLAQALEITPITSPGGINA